MILKNFTILWLFIKEGGGILISLILGLIIFNIQLEHDIFYNVIHKPIFLNKDISIHKVLHLILLPLYFFLIGLEMRYEFFYGTLSNAKERSLPLIGALFGVIFPSLIYIGLSIYNKEQIQGWTIPCATDIAFSLAAIRLLPNFCKSLKVFITALAVIDDMIAVFMVVILFSNIGNLFVLILFLLFSYFLMFLSCTKFRFHNYIYFFIIFPSLLFISNHLEINGTIIGFFCGFCISKEFKKSKYNEGEEILEQQNKSYNNIHLHLSNISNILILPIFSFSSMDIELFKMNPFSLDFIAIKVFVSLFIGKQIGIFLSSYFLIRSKVILNFKNIRILDLYIASVLCGIGFTMSIFMAGLSFDNFENVKSAKIGAVIGSLTSFMYAFMLYRYFNKGNSLKR